jgi:alpha-glucoside transport system substrate-binding protein
MEVSGSRVTRDGVWHRPIRGGEHVSRTRTAGFIAPLTALALIVTACGGGPSGSGGAASGSPAASAGQGGTPAASGGTGGSITITSLWGGSEQEAFEEVLAAFTESSGITATYEPVRDQYATALQARITGGNPPDVAIIPGIGFLRRFARDESLIPVSELGIDRAAIEANYAPGILDIGTVDDELYGIMVKFNSKSTMWYRPDTFEELGVEPPEDWEGFKALIEEIKAGGETPLGLGASDSWTLTDWFESIYVRQAGPEAYDKLFSAEGDWTDPTVAAALEEMTAVLNDDNVVGGIDAAMGAGFVDGIGQVFSANPQAVMYYEGGFVGGIATVDVNKDLEIGESIDWFDFPSFGDGGDAVTIGGDVIAALTTNPGVAEFMEYMTTPESGEVWAATGAIISPVKGVPTEVYPTELVQREAEQVANASAVRFDGSDLLPSGPDLGALLQSAIRGEDVGPLLEEFQQAATTAWESE